MESIDLKGLNVDQLSALVGQVQTEMASREKRKRHELRNELERRVIAEGYKMSDIFPRARGGCSDRPPPPENARQVPQSAEFRGDLDRYRAFSEMGSGDSERTRD